DGVRLQGREDVVPGELLAEVGDDDLLGAGLRRLARHRAHVVALADVGHEGDDGALVLVLDPLEEDRGVQSAGVRQDDLLGHAEFFWVDFRSRILLASLRAGTPSLTTTRSVSSPATVPTTSDQPIRSRARPMGPASPGSLLTTRRLPEQSIFRTSRARIVAAFVVAGGVTASTGAYRQWAPSSLAFTRPSSRMSRD